MAIDRHSIYIRRSCQLFGTWPLAWQIASTAPNNALHRPPESFVARFLSRLLHPRTYLLS